MGEPASETQAGLLPGVVIADRYKLVEPRGEGAMGAVWSATHLTLGHTVAIKFLHGNIASSAEPRARFEREAKLAARLGEASRHITRVTDHGISREGTPYLVMELLHGEGLEKRLKRDRRLPMTLVARITAQLSRALMVAHSAGVVHRDLKPANVFLCEGEGEAGDIWVKLLDFGVAKATLENEENATTRAGALIGTPNYMSPEQIVGNVVDHRSDLWAVAAIVYRMAVGKAPFGSGSLSELAMRIVSTEAPTPTTQAPDLPHEFDLFVQKGLSKDPLKRFQSARELSDSLAMVAGISATGSTGSYSSGAAERLALQIGDSVGGLQHTVDGSAAAPMVPAPIERPRSRVPIFIALGALVAGGVGVGLWAAQHRSHDAPANVVDTTTTAKTKDTTTAAPAPTVTTTTTATPAPTAATNAPSDSDSETAASTTATTKGPKKTWVAPKGAKTTSNSTPTNATATAPTATAAPTAAPTADKADELWKKKDEM